MKAMKWWVGPCSPVTLMNAGTVPHQDVKVSFHFGIFESINVTKFSHLSLSLLSFQLLNVTPCPAIITTPLFRRPTVLTMVPRLKLPVHLAIAWRDPVLLPVCLRVNGAVPCHVVLKWNPLPHCHLHHHLAQQHPQCLPPHPTGPRLAVPLPRRPIGPQPVPQPPAAAVRHIPPVPKWKSMEKVSLSKKNIHLLI